MRCRPFPQASNHASINKTMAKMLDIYNTYI